MWKHNNKTDTMIKKLLGHPEAMAYPYNTCLWNGEIRRNSEEYGDDWWRYEQTAYYTDALLRLTVFPWF